MQNLGQTMNENINSIEQILSIVSYLSLVWKQFVCLIQTVSVSIQHTQKGLSNQRRKFICHDGVKTKTKSFRYEKFPFAI